MTDELNCEQVVRKLWQFLDGELDRASSRALQAHLEVCRQCFSRTEFERRLKALVSRAGGEEEAPPGLQERVAKVLRQF